MPSLFTAIASCTDLDTLLEARRLLQKRLNTFSNTYYDFKLGKNVKNGVYTFVSGDGVAKEPIPETSELQGNGGAESVCQIKIDPADLAVIEECARRIEACPGPHDKALDVARSALEGFDGSNSEHADLFVTTYAAALKVVAA